MADVPLHRRPNAEAIMLADINRWLEYTPAMGPIMVFNGMLVLDRARALWSDRLAQLAIAAAA